MSYSLARAQIVSVIQAITPTDQTVFNTKFVHLPGGAGKNVTSRSFWLEANVDGEGGVTGPYTPDLAGQPRFTFTMTLTVHYRDHGPRANEVDIALASDQRDVAVALLNPANWNRDTTGLISITNAPLYMPTKRIESGAGIEMRCTFPMYFAS